MDIKERKLHTIDFSLSHNENSDDFNEVEVFKRIINKCKDKSVKIGFKRMFDPEEIEMINALHGVINTDKEYEKPRVKEID
jgi:hypothetical protein